MTNRQRLVWTLECGGKLYHRGIKTTKEECEILWNYMLEGRTVDEAIIAVYGEEECPTSNSKPNAGSSPQTGS